MGLSQLAAVALVPSLHLREPLGGGGGSVRGLRDPSSSPALDLNLDRFSWCVPATG